MRIICDFLDSFSYFHNAFSINMWGWAHALGGGVLYLLFRQISRVRTAMWMTFAVAFFWEVYQWAAYDVVSVYGSQFRWACDSFGDIFLAMVCAYLVRLGERR